MILALELCEEIVVYGMVSDSYCRSGRGRRGAGEAGRTVGLALEDLGAVGHRVCGLPGGWWRHGHPWSWCPGRRGSAPGTGSMPISTLPRWP